MKRHPNLAISALSRRTALGRAATVAAAVGLGEVDRVGAQDATPLPPREERDVSTGRSPGPTSSWTSRGRQIAPSPVLRSFLCMAAGWSIRPGPVLLQGRVPRARGGGVCHLQY